MTHDLSRKILEGIINLSIDLGIVVNPVKHPDLILKKLYIDKVMFWRAVNSKNTSKQHDVLICDQNLSQTQRLLKLLDKRGITFKRTLTSNSLEVIAGLTAGGVGIGILPSCVALSAYPKILKPLPSMPLYKDEIYLAYRHENRDIRAIDVIVSAINLYFKSV